MTDPDRARSQRLRRRQKPGWCRWRATRPRTTVIRTSCGRRVFWRATRASTGRQRDTDVSPILSKARYARFAFTFTPKHGSWLNLIEGFFSKFARSVLRHIRAASKQELKERIMLGIKDVNRHPVVHTWSYKLAEAA